jgi:serine/threonine protein phosphatase PrpC
MGGHQDGEKASAITARTVATQVLNTMYFPLIAKQTLNNDVPITETLANAIQKANTEIMANVPDGGTTLSAAVIIGDRAYIAHVGDSRIYLLHKGQIEKLTRDHSLVQRLIELDQITLEEANEHPQKNVLYRALGQNENVEVDTLTRRLPSGGLLLLCSDGLWNQVSEEEITDAVLHTRNLQEACHKLVTLANNHGGVDNVTVVLLQLPG